MAKNHKDTKNSKSWQETKQHDDAWSTWAGAGRKVAGRRGEAWGRKTDEKVRKNTEDQATRRGWW